MLDIVKNLNVEVEEQPPPSPKLQPDATAWHLAVIANYQPAAFGRKLSAYMARKELTRVDLGIHLREQETILTCHLVCMLLDGDIAWNGLHMMAVAGLLKLSTGKLMKALMDETLRPVLEYVDPSTAPPKDFRKLLAKRPSRRTAPTVPTGWTGTKTPLLAHHSATLPALTHEVTTMDTHNQSVQPDKAADAIANDAVTEVVADIIAHATAAAEAATDTDVGVPAKITVTQSDVTQMPDFQALLSFANDKATSVLFKTRLSLLIQGGGLNRSDFLDWLVAIGEFKQRSSAANLFTGLKWSPERLQRALDFLNMKAAVLLNHVQTVNNLEKAKALNLTLVIPAVITSVPTPPAEPETPDVNPAATQTVATQTVEPAVSEPAIQDEAATAAEQTPVAGTVAETPEPEVEADVIEDMAVANAPAVRESDPVTEQEVETVLEGVVETPEVPVTVERQPKLTSEQLLHTAVLQQLQELAEDPAATDAEKRRIYARLLGVLNEV